MKERIFVTAADKDYSISKIILQLLPCILGICVLAFGIIGILKEKKRTENYETVQGYCSEHVYSYTNDEGNSYYRWTYSYMADGQEYSVTTNFDANFYPAIGSKRIIKYNPARPGDAFIPGMSFHHIAVLAGIIITAVTLINLLNTFVKYCPVDLCGIVKGIALALSGFGVNYLLIGSFSVPSAYEALGYVVILPIIFIAVGICVAIRSLFRKMGNKEIIEDGRIDMHQ